MRPWRLRGAGRAAWPWLGVGGWVLGGCLACVLRLEGQPAPEDPRRDRVVTAVERAMPSVVNIATEEVMPIRDPLDSLFQEFFGPYYGRRMPDTQYSLGSGVIIDEEGYIVTNYHVVSRARRVWVRLADGREWEAEKVLETPSTDVAILKIRAGMEDRFSAVTFADDDDLLLGETVLALGNPFGLGGSVSRGILSSKSRRPPRENEPLDVMDWLQTDAAINPGNSGGPLINLRGDLIGLSVAIYREGQGIGFAVPVKRVARAVAMMFSPDSMDQLWFGARVRPGGRRLPVAEVDAGSPAEQAGLESGDVIVRINGEEPRGYFDFHRRLVREGKDRPVRLQVERQGEAEHLTLRMVAQATVFNEDLIRRRLGISVQELTPELARALGYGRLQGLLVSEVEPDTLAARARLDQGMLVTRMDGQPVSEVTDAAQRIHAKKSGETLRLDLVVPRQRGPVYFLQEAGVNLTLP